MGTRADGKSVLEIKSSPHDDMGSVNMVMPNEQARNPPIRRHGNHSTCVTPAMTRISTRPPKPERVLVRQVNYGLASQVRKYLGPMGVERCRRRETRGATKLVQAT